jgi:hypothetical protein
MVGLLNPASPAVHFSNHGPIGSSQQPLEGCVVDESHFIDEQAAAPLIKELSQSHWAGSIIRSVGAVGSNSTTKLGFNL